MSEKSLIQKVVVGMNEYEKEVASNFFRYFLDSTWVRVNRIRTYYSDYPEEIVHDALDCVISLIDNALVTKGRGNPIGVRPFSLEYMVKISVTTIYNTEITIMVSDLLGEVEDGSN